MPKRITLTGIERAESAGREMKALAAFHGRNVRIWSGEWKLYWRAGSAGYTGKVEEAGVYAFGEALAKTRHCGPEKCIAYELVEEAAGPAPLFDFESADAWAGFFVARFGQSHQALGNGDLALAFSMFQWWADHLLAEMDRRGLIRLSEDPEDDGAPVLPIVHPDGIHWPKTPITDGDEAEETRQ
ncbi:hypothetical protein [Afifella sp. IM 167]|uniref:hypothetical protein n=1 Tax=Afifella sp. IM 167 TaxID=2033586 RepID=UPI001CCE7F96|nr:hypothetical protein [Afifella sp. IM 167]MBZ8133253.1 hypothetical protein [Afifella sp. IM 167]